MSLLQRNASLYLLKSPYCVPFHKQSPYICVKCQSKLYGITTQLPSKLGIFRNMKSFVWPKFPSWCFQRYQQRLGILTPYRTYYHKPHQIYEECESSNDFDQEQNELGEENAIFPEHSIDEASFAGEDIKDDTPTREQSGPKYSAHHFRGHSGFLLNYVQACINTGHTKEAFQAVMKRSELKVNDMKTIEYLLQTLVELKLHPLNFQVNFQSIDAVKLSQKLFSKVLKFHLSPSPRSCACILAIFKICERDDLLRPLYSKVKELHNLQQCLDACYIKGDTYNFLKNIIKTLEPDFEIQSNAMNRGELPSIVKDLYDTSPSSESFRLPETVNLDDVLLNFDAQFKKERKGVVRIPNVLSSRQPFSTEQKTQIRMLNKLHVQWKYSALQAFKQIKIREKKRWFDGRSHELGIYPFLCLLPDKSYAEIIVEQLYYIPPSGDITHNIVSAIGDAVFIRYLMRHDKLPKSEQLKTIYKNYLLLYTNKQNGFNFREFWKKLEEEWGVLQVENRIVPWQGLWKTLVGRKLLEVMVSDLKVGIGSSKTPVPTAYFSNIPAVFNCYRTWGKKMLGMTVPHAMYVKMVKGAKKPKGTFIFPTEHLPMLVLPLPWIHPDQGGFLCYPTDFIRKQRYMDSLHSDEYKDSLGATADALNVLSCVAWKINKRILDVQLKIFCLNGDTSLKIAPPPPEIPLILKNLGSAPAEEQKLLKEQYYKAKKLRYEMNSLHADALYKFSIADYYRDKILWLPHNLDFRGRTYPTPPHFNYMGDDVSRSLFMFANGRPLGKRGIEWLKIHLINLTGKKKHENLQSRLEYADEMLNDIFDSADSPLDGRCWWKDSDDPWQTLSACMELTDALRSPNPEKYISHLPIHQDGSCNGLQHYAALGRDVIGAKQVNLTPSDIPQDIYTRVAEIVDEQRKKDAENGDEIAKDLEGFINRKVVKQTVMTTVYGVTRSGGALQINRQLMKVDFPSEKCSLASSYIVKAIFGSISGMFTSATSIQGWFTELATHISQGGQPVEWETKLGLRVVQPYFKTVVYQVDSPLQIMSVLGPGSLPRVMKQCNAFPPNFVHSLDSTHMMLTALHCYHAGIMFSAVHDCYWTHASTVDTMNVLCREQFIELHSQPILEQLAVHLNKFLSDNEMDQSKKLSTPFRRERLRELLSDIPAKGEFNLNEVKNSTFFFS